MGRCDKKTLSLYYKGTEWERQEGLQLRGPLSAKTSGRDQRSGSGRYPIDQGIGCGADSQPRQHIQNGVLLEEYGRQADEHGHGQKAQPPALGAEAPDVPGGEVHRKGADDVNRGADVGVGVRGVQLCGEPRQQIAAQQCGPQMLAVGEEKVGHQSKGVRQDDEPHHPPESGNVIK